MCAVLTFLTICAAEEGEGRVKEQGGKMMGVMQMVGTGTNIVQLQMQMGNPNTAGIQFKFGKIKNKYFIELSLLT